MFIFTNTREKAPYRFCKARFSPLSPCTKVRIRTRCPQTPGDGRERTGLTRDAAILGQYTLSHLYKTAPHHYSLLDVRGFSELLIRERSRRLLELYLAA